MNGLVIRDDESGEGSEIEWIIENTIKDQVPKSILH